MNCCTAQDPACVRVDVLLQRGPGYHLVADRAPRPVAWQVGQLVAQVLVPRLVDEGAAIDAAGKEVPLGPDLHRMGQEAGREAGRVRRGPKADGAGVAPPVRTQLRGGGPRVGRPVVAPFKVTAQVHLPQTVGVLPTARCVRLAGVKRCQLVRLVLFFFFLLVLLPDKNDVDRLTSVGVQAIGLFSLVLI